MFGGGSDDDRYGAYAVCQEEVESRLKAPATAGFPALSETSWSKSGEVYTIRGWVDAQNSFGALVRTNFVCIATHTTGDRFTVSVSMS